MAWHREFGFGHPIVDEIFRALESGPGGRVFIGEDGLRALRESLERAPDQASFEAAVDALRAAGLSLTSEPRAMSAAYAIIDVAESSNRLRPAS